MHLRLVVEETKSSRLALANALDVPMAEGTEFGRVAPESLLAIAAVLRRDLEEAGFGSADVRVIAAMLASCARTARGGRN